MQKKGVVLAAVILILGGCSETEVSDTELYNKAEKYYEESDLYSSIIELKNTLQRNSELYDARILLGTIYLEVGVGESAEKEFRYAQKIGGQSAYLSYQIAQALFAQRKYQEVVDTEALSAGGSGKQNALNYALLAKTYVYLDDVDKARIYLDKALQIDGSSMESKLAEMRVLTLEGRYKKSREAMKALLAEYPDESLVWHAGAGMAFSRGDMAEAIRAYRKVIELEPVKPTTRLVFYSKISLSRALMLDKQTDEAKLTIDELMAKYSTHPAVLYLGASIAYELKDIDLALNRLLLVLDMAPNYYPAIMLLGATHYTKGNYEQANAGLERYVNEYPENIVARKLLAATSYKLDKPEGVIDALLPIIDKNNDTDLLMMIGRASFQIGEIDTGAEYIEKAKGLSPESVSIRSELARVYMEQGKHDQAVGELQSIKGVGEKQAEIATVLVYMQGNELSKARKLASELTKKNPESLPYMVLQGSVELEAGERLKARGLFENAVILSPDSIPAILHLARMDMEDEKFSSAKKGYKRVLTIDPENIGAMFGLAQLAEQRGSIEQATDWLEKIRAAEPGLLMPRLVLGRYYLKKGELVKALELAEEAKTNHIDEPAALLLLSQVYMAMNSYDNALLLNKQLVELLPGAPGPYFELAKTQVELQHYEAAKKSLKAVLKLKPDFIGARVLLASIDIHLDNYEDALVQAKQIQKSSPSVAIGYQLAGSAYSGLKQYPQAERSFKKAYDIAPSSLLASRLASVYMERDNFTLAEATLLTWLKSAPKDIVAISQLAVMYQEAQKLIKAEKYYLQVLNHEPGNIKALNNLAMLLLDKGDIFKASEYAKQVYQADSQNVFVKDTYGWSLVMLGKVSAGLKLIGDAAEKSTHPSIQYHYAYALNKMGESEKARRVLGEVLNDNKPFPEYEQAQKLFGAL